MTFNQDDCNIIFSNLKNEESDQNMKQKTVRFFNNLKSNIQERIAKPKCSGLFLCISGIIVAFLIVSILIGYMSNTKVEDRTDDGSRSFYLGGSYVLNATDSNFEPFYVSFGYPRFVISLLKASKQMLRVIQPSILNKNWTFVILNEFTNQSFEFEMGKPFHHIIQGQILSTVEHKCQRFVYHIIECTSKEPRLSLTYSHRYIFSLEGLIEEKHNKGIYTNKTYNRITDPKEAMEDENNILYGHTTTDFSFPDDPDDGFMN